MSLIAPVENGQIVGTTAEEVSESTNKREVSNTLDKDAFLQLLVAQMKYQDPMEPTSNTEYVAQLATFSQLEETQNLNYTMTKSQANDLVGKQVILKTTSEVTGDTTYVQGYVDYVAIENNKTYLYVNGALYSIDDLDRIVDDAYLAATQLADQFKLAVSQLPDPDTVTLEDEEKIANLGSVYASLSDYQKSYISEDVLTQFQKVVEAFNALKAANESANSEA